MGISYTNKINAVVLARVINQNQTTFGQDTVWKLQPEKQAQKCKTKLAPISLSWEPLCSFYGAVSKGKCFKWFSKG